MRPSTFQRIDIALSRDLVTDYDKIKQIADHIGAIELIGTAIDSGVDFSDVAKGLANYARADKDLASRNIANMVYTDGNLTKIQYNTATDVDYETLGYTSGKLTSIRHYIGSVLKGTTTLTYSSGTLVSAVFVGV